MNTYINSVKKLALNSMLAFLYSKLIPKWKCCKQSHTVNSDTKIKDFRIREIIYA